MKAVFVPDDKVTISQFTDNLNDMRDEAVMKRLASVHITTVLKEEGYLFEDYNPLLGRNETYPTEKGQSEGITADSRVSGKGNEYAVIMYDKNAQILLLDIIERITG